MRKNYINMIVFLFLFFSLIYFSCNTTSGNSHIRQVYKLEQSFSISGKAIDTSARQTSIYPQVIFVLFVTTIINSFEGKVYLWKAELPVFWGSKYRIQSPRCKLC